MISLADAFPEQQIVVTLSRELGWCHFVELGSDFGFLPRQKRIVVGRSRFAHKVSRNWIIRVFIHVHFRYRRPPGRLALPLVRGGIGAAGPRIPLPTVGICPPPGGRPLLA